MRNRSYRRHQAHRAKRRAFRLFYYVWGSRSLADDPRFLGMYARTRKPCSCVSCQNHTRKPAPPVYIFDDTCREVKRLRNDYTNWF